MQNKANLLDDQMNVTSVLKNYYENKRWYGRGQNKPNQTQFQNQHLSKLFWAFTFVCPGYIANASIFFCPNAPKKFKYLQQSWDAGDSWNNTCFLEKRLFKGASTPAVGRGKSKLLVSCYFGFGHWRNENFYGDDNYMAYGSCEKFKKSKVTPGSKVSSAFWSRLDSGGNISLDSFEIKLHAGFTDGHVESFTPSETVPMKVIRDRSTNDPYDYGPPGPGIFYLPRSALH